MITQAHYEYQSPQELAPSILTDMKRSVAVPESAICKCFPVVAEIIYYMYIVIVLWSIITLHIKDSRQMILTHLMQVTVFVQPHFASNSVKLSFNLRNSVYAAALAAITTIRLCTINKRKQLRDCRRTLQTILNRIFICYDHIRCLETTWNLF